MDFLLTLIGLFHYSFKMRRYDFRHKQLNDIGLFNKKIKKLYLNGCLKTPYYQNLFHEIKFDVENITLENFKKIPVLSKEFLKNNVKEFYSDNYDRFSISFKTSGTTGEPMKSYVDYKHWVIEQAVIWRHWFQAGYRIGDHIAILRSYTPRENQSLIKHSTIVNWTYYSPYHMDDTSLLSYYRDMQRRQTKALRGYPSSLAIFADYCRRNDFSLPHLKFCLTASEVLTKQERSLIEQVFSVKVYDHYGLAETIVMLHDFGDSIYYNCTEYGFLELLDTVNPEVKRIIGTNLNNNKFPLLRYDTGDLAIVKDDEIISILGRKDLFIYDNNKKVPSVNFYTTFYKVDGILKWQMVQESKDEICIRLKIDSRFDSKEVTQNLDSLINLSIRKNYFVNEEFEKSGEGKIKPIIQRVLNEEFISF